MTPPKNDRPKATPPVKENGEADNPRREQQFRDCLEDDDVAEVLDRLHHKPKPCER